jgi:hypothetical protein
MIVLSGLVVGPSTGVAYARPDGHQDGARGGVAAAFVGSGPPVVPGDESQSSLTASLLKSVAEGAAGEVGGQLAGWVLGAAGLGSDSTSAGIVAEQLQALQQIESDLNGIWNEIANLNCNALSSDLLQDRDNILTWYETYQGFVETAADGFVPNQADVNAWIADVLSEQTNQGLLNAINDIDTQLMGVPGGSQGAIAGCLDPQLIPPPQPGTLNDATHYYDEALRLTRYFYGQQVQGLAMLADAYHLQVQELYQQGVGKYPNWPKIDDPSDAAQLCSADYVNTITPIDPALSGSIVNECLDAFDATNYVYEHLAGQFERAGAPYQSTNVAAYTADGATKLFVKSVHDFTNVAHLQDPTNIPDCPLPLTSANPCGILKGNYSSANPADTFKTSQGPVVYGADLLYGANDPAEENSSVWQGYDQWRPASYDEMDNLIAAARKQQGDSTGTIGTVLSNAGFDSPFNLLIVSHQSFDYQIPWNINPTNTTVMKFVDTAFPDGNVGSGDALESLAIQQGPECNFGSAVFKTEWRDERVGSIDRNGFYDVRLDPCSGDQKWEQDPGWHTTAYQTPQAQQYRWPVISSTSLSCSPGRSHTNPGGVQTRCGRDFDAWFDEQVPRPVTCQAPTTGDQYGQCTSWNPWGDQIDIALAGPQAGEWSSPVLSGDVTVAFDRDTARRITGTVVLPSTDGHGTATVRFDINRAGREHTFYTGTVKIDADRHRQLTVPLRHVELEHQTNGTVSGQVMWRRGHQGTYTLRFAVRDSNPG